MSLPFTCIKDKAWIALLLFAVTFPATAADIETLLMPGKVIQGHAETESQCTSCHERFSKSTQDKLCIDCHDKVAKDLKQREGYHGRSKKVRNSRCSSCHTDHKGRDAKIVLLDRELFDHDLTDYKLDGAHNQAQCISCHKKENTWREAPGQCIDCHREQDVHEGEFGKQCSDCHTTETWSEKEFDHDTTDFPLKGEHAETVCAACHINKRYKDTPKTCISCHRDNDVHRGGFGTNCNSCHVSSKWKTVKFNHDKTDFKLRGMHDEISCSACHLPGKEAKKLATGCISCHRTDDAHKGRNGERCQDCHTSDSWGKSRFNHDKDTNFPLRGPHEKATCTACHADGVRKDAPVRQCIDCHKADDVHQGELGSKCDTCHVAQSWNKQLSFDHDLTRFPLYGLHALANCESCHTEGRYASLPHDCNDCHRTDDNHKGALGNSCETCHNANGWRLWRFDHETTDFPLTGSHDGLACNSCHHTGPTSETPMECVSCHQADDVHHGRFGRNCSRCHSSDDFKNIRMRPSGGNR